VNRSQALRAVIFALIVSCAAFVGPRLGEAVSGSDDIVWQLLPWVLIALCWIALGLWIRRARRAQ
jgi:hypothetical protein